MEHQFSPGLLYSVAPENFSELHLQDEQKVDAFEWEKPEPTLLISSLAMAALDLVKKITGK